MQPLLDGMLRPNDLGKSHFPGTMSVVVVDFPASTAYRAGHFARPAAFLAFAARKMDRVEWKRIKDPASITMVAGYATSAVAASTLFCHDTLLVPSPTSLWRRLPPAERLPAKRPPRSRDPTKIKAERDPVSSSYTSLVRRTMRIIYPAQMSMPPET